MWLAIVFSGRGSQEERLTRAAHSASLGSALPGGRVTKPPLVEACANAPFAKQVSIAATRTTSTRWTCLLFASFMDAGLSGGFWWSLQAGVPNLRQRRIGGP